MDKLIRPQRKRKEELPLIPLQLSTSHKKDTMLILIVQDILIISKI